jgi:ATP-binding cassette subfamily B protein
MQHQNFDVEPGIRIKWYVIKLLVPYFLEFKQRVILALICLILAKLATIYIPFILKHIVDVFSQHAQGSKALLAAPLGLVLAYGLARFTNVVLNEARDTIFGRVTEQTIHRIGLQAFKHLHALDLDFHLNRRTGGLSRDLERGTSGINMLMRILVFNILPTLFEVLMVIGLLSYHYGIIFAIIVLVLVLAYIAYSIIATDWRTRYVREMNTADSASNARAIDSLLNYETVKYFTNEKYEASRYDENLTTWEVAKRKNRLTIFVLNGGQAFIIAAGTTSMLALAAIRVTQGIMTIGDFVLINAFMMQIFIPLNFLGFVYREIKGSLANIEHMFDLLRLKPKIADTEEAKSLTLTHGEIEFKNISFHYQPERRIIKNLSFSVKQGEKVALVGESGSGKSTLVKLLFRFYDCQQGSIFLNNKDIRQITQESLRKAIGIVPQDTVLFNDSILENVRYGKVTASDEEVLEAIRHAHLDRFIADLPKGVHTPVGERGLKLSGGEKQRVAIARTILKHPPILVFDEATSSLDSHSEQAILKAIKEISSGYTSLVIAHRLSTIIDADRIILLSHGEVAEEGSHEKLLSLNGKYAHLWHVQQKEQQSTNQDMASS